MKKALKDTKCHWTESYNDTWNKSNLSSLIEKPSVEVMNKTYENGLGLKIMSVDLNTTEKVGKNKNR